MQSVASPPRNVGVSPRRVSGDAVKATLLLAALVGLGALGTSFETTMRPPEDRTQNGAAWEGRRLLAQMLWLKTHAVIHAGVEERSARPGEVVSAANAAHPEEGHDHDEHAHEAAHPDHEEGEEHESHAHEHAGEHEGHAHEHGDGHDHGGQEVLVIPAAAGDFRGILGDLERTTKPYMGVNGERYEKDADQTVPFYRLMTWADPHFIQGYTVGATFLCRTGKHVKTGIDFLLEGERNNPNSFEIQTELGHFYLVYAKEYALAEQHLVRALALVPTGRELTEPELEAREDAYRWLGLTYREWNRSADALRIAHEGLKVLGEDPTLRLILAHRGLRK